MNSFWRSCLDHFERQLPPQQFKTWIKPLRFQAVDQALTLTAPNRFVLQWIRDRFLGEIQRMAAERLGDDVTVKRLRRSGERVELLPENPDFEPIRWHIDNPRRQQMWGGIAPKSWFTEGSQVEAFDGSLVQLEEPEFAGVPAYIR